jgi:hypothetical protein
VVSVALGAPVRAPALTCAPMPDAPLNATTVSDTSSPPDDVAVTTAFVSAVEEFACHTSVVPAWLLPRWSSVQVKPPPVTDAVVVELAAPSALTNATTRSPARFVLNAGVETVLTPSAETVLSMAMGGVVVGVTAFDGADGALLPTLFEAVTLNVYAVPFVRPFTTVDVAGGDPVTGVEVCAVEPMNGVTV